LDGICRGWSSIVVVALAEFWTVLVEEVGNEKWFPGPSRELRACGRRWLESGWLVQSQAAPSATCFTNTSFSIRDEIHHSWVPRPATYLLLLVSTSALLKYRRSTSPAAITLCFRFEVILLAPRASLLDQIFSVQASQKSAT
jgi:hypothetical protein